LLFHRRITVSPSIAYRRVRLCGRLAVFGALLGAVVATAPPLAHAQAPKPAPDEMRWGLHVTLVSRWLDPAETEAFSTPFMVMYAIHDAMVRPMPAGLKK
jgi:peptide/nickel transport system substrate-binding protein